MIALEFRVSRRGDKKIPQTGFGFMVVNLLFLVVYSSGFKDEFSTQFGTLSDTTRCIIEVTLKIRASLICQIEETREKFATSLAWLPSRVSANLLTYNVINNGIPRRDMKQWKKPKLYTSEILSANILCAIIFEIRIEFLFNVFVFRLLSLAPNFFHHLRGLGSAGKIRKLKFKWDSSIRWLRNNFGAREVIRRVEKSD